MNVMPISGSQNNSYSRNKNNVSFGKINAEKYIEALPRYVERMNARICDSKVNFSTIDALSSCEGNPVIFKTIIDTIKNRAGGHECLKDKTISIIPRPNGKICFDVTTRGVGIERVGDYNTWRFSDRGNLIETFKSVLRERPDDNCVRLIPLHCRYSDAPPSIAYNERGFARFRNRALDHN